MERDDQTGIDRILAGLMSSAAELEERSSKALIIKGSNAIVAVGDFYGIALKELLVESAKREQALLERLRSAESALVGGVKQSELAPANRHALQELLNHAGLKQEERAALRSVLGVLPIG